MRASLKLSLTFAALTVCAGPTLAASSSQEIGYGPPAGWVLSPPPPTDAADPPNAPVRVAYVDTQIHIDAAGTHTYGAWRIRILKPEGLKIGNVMLGWNPSYGKAIVHTLHIIRQGQTIDVLKTAHFQVIQREGGLEQSMLTGDLTAMLQVPGLQVGDELEMASTSLSRDPTLGDHTFGLYQMPVQGLPGAYRYRLQWPAPAPLVWRGTRDLPVALPVNEGGEQTVTLTLRDPHASIINDDAPARYNIRRLVEYSDLASWRDASKLFWPLFDHAARLAPDSPLHAEVARITAASTDPAERVRAALRLVQDQVRYVYVGLNGGNYRPASADETWSRRFGDCKAKTALLLALLHEMNIDAEPVLVNPLGDDGLDQRLPSPSVFVHVLVRATVNGTHYWLDGTRSGDVWLDMLPEPSFHWALPVRAAGADLEAVTPRAFARPQTIQVLDMDASAGFDQPAKVALQNLIRGDEAFVVRTQLAALAPDDADHALRNYWRQQESWVVPDSVKWDYDERRKTLVLTMAGHGRPDWQGSTANGHDLTLWHAGFYPPRLLHRSPDQDQSAPWLTDFPTFECLADTVHLPRPDPKWRWALDAKPMNVRIGDVVYWRAVGLRDGLVRTVKSRSVEKAEISAVDAQNQNNSIPGFNNLTSRVYEQPAGIRPTAASDQLPFGDGIDWVNNDSVCSPPKQAEPRPIALKP